MRNRIGALISLASLLVGGIVFSIVPLHRAQALSLLADDKVITEKDLRVSDDQMIAGGQIEINSPVDGDLYITGGSVTVNADIMRDLIVFGGDVEINGNVADDLIVVGGNVSVKSPIIGDNLTLAGGNVQVSDAVVIGGDVTGAAGAFRFDGKVAKKLNVAAQAVDLRGTVEGAAEIRAEEVNIARTARVTGNLDYFSKSDAKIDSEAVVRGITTKHEINKDMNFGFFDKKNPMTIVAGALIGMIALLIVGLLFVHFFPHKTMSVLGEAPRQAWKNFGIGFGIVFFAPIPLLFVASTIVGLPLALMGFAAYGVLLYIGELFLALFLGFKLFSLAKRVDIANATSSQLMWAVVLGVIVLGVIHLLKLIPGIGMIAFVILFLAKLVFVGALATFDMKFLKQARSQKML